MEEPEGPVTHTFLEALFSSLREDLESIKRDLSSDLRERRQEKRVALESEVATLETTHKCTGAQKVWRDLEKALLYLKRLEQDRDEYAILRLKHTFYLSNNCSGRMLAHQLHSKTHAREMKAIWTGPTTMTETESEAANAFRAIYSTLYSSADSPGANPLANLEASALKLLTEAEALDVLICVEKVISAIARLKAIKIPQTTSLPSFTKPSARS
ncbi:hypothetical protein NDU88_006472 [Pleurodeles waltl]|uniref:Uncharacterized protein n=1 Tax=Pleurodeles waltl TaxID=8319 RepID=A0AAV7RN60_PLEWA|nr:hypothetical protein NDU88_006472 [Pleurodeles waltl]